MITKAVRYLAPIFVVSLLGLMGCTMYPYEGQVLVSEGTDGGVKPMNVQGFATLEGALLRVQAFDRFRSGFSDAGEPDAWRDIAYITAEQTAFQLGPQFNPPLYRFMAEVRVPAYFYDASKRARVRVQMASGGDWYSTFMYDQAGIDCLIGRWASVPPGGTLDTIEAGSVCSNRQEVTIQRP